MRSGRIRSITPDLFSKAPARDASSPSEIAPSSLPPNNQAPARHVLPTDLPTAIKQLEDSELDRLLAAALAEQKQRGRKLPVSDESPRRGRVQAVAVHLTQGKLNAVRSAFKAAISPSRIARQFGISQANVRKALASDERRR
jgi:hypothetical protein